MLATLLSTASLPFAALPLAGAWPVVGGALLGLALAMAALRCAGLAVSLWTYDASLSAIAALAALGLGGGALAAAGGLLEQAARALSG